jgi:hypothetical protein
MKKPKRTEDRSIDRRTFVKVLPAAGAAVIAASQAPLSALAQTASPTPSPSPRPAPTPGRIKKNDLEHTEKVIGIDLSDKHREMALSGVNTNLDRYDAVRKIDVPLDTVSTSNVRASRQSFGLAGTNQCNSSRLKISPLRRCRSSRN